MFTLLLKQTLDAFRGKDDLDGIEGGDGAMSVTTQDRLRFILEHARSRPVSKEENVDLNQTCGSNPPN